MLHVRPLRSGDFIEVRSFPEIAATLDRRGELEGLPFMPEMLPYCGKRFEVWKRADKTCDEAAGGSIRRLRNVVHLKELRCGGEAHDGCDAGCLLFWKEQWLKPVASLSRTGASAPASPIADSEYSSRENSLTGVLGALHRATRYSPQASADGPQLYSCQSTEITRFSEPLRWWDLRQYVRDVRGRNVTLREFAAGIFIGVFNKTQDLHGGRTFDAVAGPNTRTPQGSSHLAPGDFVEIKSRDEIASTLDRHGKNRGLSFRPVMVPYCGKRYRVLRRVNSVIDPRSRKMISLRENSLILDGVICGGEARRFCPRAVYTFWRDIWLNKVPESQPEAQPACAHAQRSFINRLASLAQPSLAASIARALRVLARKFRRETLKTST